MKVNKLFKMLPVIFFAGSIFFAPQTVSGQLIQFAETYMNFGEHYSYGFTELPDSGFIVFGCSKVTSSSTQYSFAMRINKYGDTIWTKNYIANASEIASILNIDDSTCIVSNGFRDPGGLAISICKINLEGDTTDRREYGYLPPGEAGHIFRTKEKGYILNNPSMQDYGLLKLDSNLNEVWHTYQNMQLGCSRIKQDYDNGYIAVGGQYGMEPYVIKKLDSAGATIWQYNHGNTLSSATDELFASDVVVMSDSNYLVGTNGPDWQLMKIDHNTGDTLWTKNVIDSAIFHSYHDYAITCMDYGWNNNYIIGGQFMMLVDQNGDSIWKKENPFPYGFTTYDAHRTSDGGYAFCGIVVKLTSPGYTAIGFVKLDSLGNTILTSVYDIPDPIKTAAKVYPNPFNETAVIKISNTYVNKKCELKITDISGHDVTLLFTPEKINIAEYVIHAANVANGLYFVAVNDGVRKNTTSFSVLK